jgi:hypothetical protein
MQEFLEGDITQNGPFSDNSVWTAVDSRHMLIVAILLGSN